MSGHKEEFDMEFGPVREVFAHLEREEQKHVHVLLHRLWVLKTQVPNPRKVQRQELAALTWALETIRDLEDVEEEEEYRQAGNREY